MTDEIRKGMAEPCGGVGCIGHVTSDPVARYEDKRREYHRRKRAALLAGGREPSPETWAAYLDKARAVVERRHRRHVSAEPATCPEPSEPHELLRPGQVAVDAETVLGLEVALADALETRENVGRHRMELLALISGARVPPAGVDLFALERGLDPEAGGGLPRDAEKQLLEVVRELIRWRAAGGGR